jgi:hypothetical protein
MCYWWDEDVEKKTARTDAAQEDSRRAAPEVTYRAPQVASRESTTAEVTADRILEKV